ncbi:hypothetical protein [Erwinia sp.]|uniref:hypothetical protein n=1 Tax=Erwinia citreus TaxID=558 RepID=UPI0028A0E10C|nr:hypothetical protein [Erwinia sp.]
MAALLLTTQGRVSCRKALTGTILINGLTQSLHYFHLASCMMRRQVALDHSVTGYTCQKTAVKPGFIAFEKAGRILAAISVPLLKKAILRSAFSFTFNKVAQSCNLSDIACQICFDYLQGVLRHGHNHYGR